METAHIVVDNQGATQRKTRWRTLAVFGHTLTGSARVVARAAGDGLERFDPHRQYLLLSNHRSLLDIPAACCTFPGRLRFVAKAELRKIPLFGRAMAESGILFVDRHNRRQAIEALSRARGLTAIQSSLWIAAEGGRSRSGSELGPFKKGPFHVATQMGVPILPMWIEGTDPIIEPGSLVSVTGRRVHVRYGTPIETRGMDIEPLLAQARTAMLALGAR